MKGLYYGVAVVGVLLVGYLLFFSGADDVKSVPTSGTTVVAFGDSLVVGVGATAGNDFVSLVSARVQEPIINLGQSGDTTRDALLRVDEVLAQDPKVVLLLIGGNDYLQHIPRSETFSNLAEIINRIQVTGAVVVLLGVRGGLLTDTYGAEYESVAASYNTPFVPDVLDGLFGRPALMSDTIHPNDAGYRIIADRVAPVLLESLVVQP